MLALRVVIYLPVFDDLEGLADASEPMLIQAFLSVPAIETLNVGVLGRLAGVDEIQLDAVIIDSSIQRPPAQFRAVINDQDIGVTRFTSRVLNHCDHPLSRQREIQLDRRALPSAVVLEVGGPELAAIGQRVAGEIERPALIGGVWAPSPFAALTRYLFLFGTPQPQPFFARRGARRP